MSVIVTGIQAGSGARAVQHGDQPRVGAHNLEIGYAGSPIVAGIDLDLRAGQSLALIGVNGSGKSTLLKTLVGLLPPLRGELTVLGARPGVQPGRIGYLSQFHDSGFVLPLRAIDVVRMGRFPALGLFGRMRPSDHELVDQALRTMGVAHLKDAPLRALSGGQQQRVYLAQVLARRADLIVLDEPTSGLDAAGREIYLQAMRAERARGAAVITATHDIQEAADCDQTMLLARKVVAAGPSREVITPEALLETFGIVMTVRDQHLSVAVVEREHGHGHD
ncbi:MAG: metal ABC transporter ATP-binding protein [Kouleothrix sp.]|nr:metal ABC transporter ATP-binding protein [Kouleothrix sp.]